MQQNWKSYLVKRLLFNGTINGDFSDKALPTEMNLNERRCTGNVY